MNHQHKWAHRYVIIPSGSREKDEVTVRLLQRKEVEYEASVQELEALRREVTAYAPIEVEELWKKALSFE